MDCGQEAADWISAYLGKPGFRMVYLPPDMKGRKVVESPNPADKAFKEDDTVSTIVISNALKIPALKSLVVWDQLS